MFMFYNLIRLLNCALSEQIKGFWLRCTAVFSTVQEKNILKLEIDAFFEEVVCRTFGTGVQLGSMTI